jgi:hypothetical protein
VLTDPLPGKRRIALRQALPILLVTILFGIVLAVLAWRGARNAGQLAAESQEFAQFSRVCEGAGLPAASTFDRQSPVHPTLIFRQTATGWELARSIIPPADFPSGLGEVQLVLCVGQPEVVTIPHCDSDQTATGAQLPLHLRAADSAATVTRRVLGLEVPADGCWPADQPVPGVPTDADIWSWVEPYVDSSR